MNQTKQAGRIASKKLRGFFNELADGICNAQDIVVLSVKDNTFVISLDGVTIDITITEEGGDA